jgi:dihydroorotate dehydrogenase
MSSFYGFHDPALETKVFGIRFWNPVGLAAGFDKNARLLHLLPALGFGFVEIGAITPRPQPGNPRPRLFHISGKHAIVNRMGFNNEGVEAVAERIRHNKSRVPLGANIGKNKDTPNEKAAQDYLTCFQKLRSLVDYIVVNVSSPNTPNLRELQKKTSLIAILEKLQEENKRNIPLLIKIAPELGDSELQGVVEVAKKTKIAGIVATNTLKTEQGGLSGTPLKKRSTEVIKQLYKKTQGRIPIVGVGGIFSGKDAYEKITAGASLVQIYTGLMYEGPGLVKRVKKELVELLKEDGFSNIQEAVGTKA